MNPAELIIEFILRVAQLIADFGNGLGWRIIGPSGNIAGKIATGIFINVITEMKHSIYIIAVRNTFVSIEIAMLPTRTADHCKARAVVIGIGCRGGFGSPDNRIPAEG